MENFTYPQDIQAEEVLLAEEDMAPQVICFDADGKAESVKLAI